MGYGLRGRICRGFNQINDHGKGLMTTRMGEWSNFMFQKPPCKKKFGDDEIL